MLAHLHIAMPPRRDVKIPLHLVPLQTAINPTTRPRHAPPQPRRLLEPSLLPPMSQHMVHVRILLLLLGQIPPLPLQRIRPLDPLLPVRGVPRQHLAREDAIARGVLDVDVQVGTEHRDDDVEVDLQLVGDALLDAEEVGFVTGVPAAELGEGQHGADEDQDEGRVTAGGGAAGICGLGFGWEEDHEPRAMKGKRMARHTESIESPQAFRETLLFPKSALIQAMVCETVHVELS